MRHVRVDHSDETVPVISADYCFMMFYEFS